MNLQIQDTRRARSSITPSVRQQLPGLSSPHFLKERASVYRAKVAHVTHPIDILSDDRQAGALSQTQAGGRF